MFLRLTEAAHYELDAQLLELYRLLKCDYSYGACAAKALQILSSVEGKLLSPDWKADFIGLKQVYPAMFAPIFFQESHKHHDVVASLYATIREMVILVCNRKGSESAVAGGLSARLIDSLAQ